MKPDMKPEHISLQLKKFWMSGEKSKRQNQKILLKGHVISYFSRILLSFVKNGK